MIHKAHASRYHWSAIGTHLILDENEQMNKNLGKVTEALKDIKEKGDLEYVKSELETIE